MKRGEIDALSSRPPLSRIRRYSISTFDSLSVITLHSLIALAALVAHRRIASPFDGG